MTIEEAIKTNKFKDMKHKATINLMYTSYIMRTQLSTILKVYDLTPEQYNVLRILKGKHPEAMCVRDIGSRMIEKSSNVPRIVDRLVAKKLVKRTTSKEDKRETLISLTEKGIEQLAAATKAGDDLEMNIAGITEEEATVLNEILEKMRAKIE
jgi:DNA-binding MarR family transcriptional regulator